MKVASHRDLIVWQKSMDLVIMLYDLTSDFPSQEMYGLTSQMRRSAVSIASNIAEGRRRGTKKDFRHFLLISYGSGAELETQIEIIRRLGYSSSKKIDITSKQLEEVMKMLNVMERKLDERNSSTSYQLPANTL